MGWFESQAVPGIRFSPDHGNHDNAVTTYFDLGSNYSTRSPDPTVRVAEVGTQDRHRRELERHLTV